MATDRAHLVPRMTERQFVEHVAAGLLEALEADHTLRLDDIASHTGYSMVTIRQFRAGIGRSIRVALAVADAVPGIANGLRCKCCGRLPDIRFERGR